MNVKVKRIKTGKNPKEDFIQREDALNGYRMAEDDMDTKFLGSKIHHLRTQRGMSRTQLSSSSGIEQDRLEIIEIGTAKVILIEEVVAIARVLRVIPDFLLSRRKCAHS